MRTPRLDLLPATLELCEAETRGRDALRDRLAARIPRSWPPPVFEPDDIQRVRKQLELDPGTPWTLYYVLLRSDDPGVGPDLIGIAGFVAPPAAEGSVEIGYAIVREYQGRGFATEAVHALLAAAFADSRVSAVTATTFPDLASSIGVLIKTGFCRTGQPAGDGTIRFERRR